MLDGMRFEELQQEFALPLYALDFASLTAAIESGVFADRERAAPVS